MGIATQIAWSQMKLPGFAWFLLMVGCNIGGVASNPAPPTSIVAHKTFLVTSVIDGDSFRTEDGENRLIGVNAPERDECFGSESREWLTRLVEGRTVEIVGNSTDQFGRQLVEVRIAGISVNLEAVTTGHAFALSDFADNLAAEQPAMEEGRGLWGRDICGASGDKPELTIDEIDFNPPGEDESELVVIGNPSFERVDLGGFVLRDESSINRFRFPDRSLEPGTTVAVTTACPEEGDVLGWCSDQPVWNNDGDAVILLDHFGRVVAFRRY
jgi:endonuclease YncB( thermonuclease family)